MFILPSLTNSNQHKNVWQCVSTWEEGEAIPRSGDLVQWRLQHLGAPTLPRYTDEGGEHSPFRKLTGNTPLPLPVPVDGGGRGRSPLPLDRGR
jgi:hypothetical protein